MGIKSVQLYLKPDEGAFLSLAVVSMIDHLDESSKNQTVNWSIEARRYMKEMLIAGNSLKVKLKKLGFDMNDLPDAGDINDFMTKES